MKEILLGAGGREEVTPETPFLGEVPATGFIDGLQLASQIGLTAGTAQNSNEPWLKFNLDSKTLFVAKRTFRHSVSWDQINAANAVYGDKIITLRGEQYRVRLLKGAASDPISGGSGQYDPQRSWGSEWNRLFYPLVPNPTNTPTHPLSREGILYGEWANYTEADLGITTGNGRYSWCQETDTANPAQRALRGYTGLPLFVLTVSSNTARSAGWRPVLELID